MIGLVRRSPFGPMFQLRSEIDDVFGRFVGSQVDETPQAWEPTWTPAVEGTREDGHYVIRVALPGVDPKDVEVAVTENELTIKGQRRRQGETMGDRYFARELAYGAFERRFTLPEGIDAAKVYAKYVNGMLEVRVPEPVVVGPKRVMIEVEGGAPKIEAASQKTA